MTSAKNKPQTTAIKKQYLMTDEGFLSSFLVNLSIMLSISFLCHQNIFPSLTLLISDIYYRIIEYMMQTANQFACWSILGLLSSACCAIQIILNIFSLGCASFNSVLGPLRPMFVALTVMAQGISWYYAHQYGLIYKSFEFGDNNAMKSVKMMLIGTLFSIVMTCMPEVLAWDSGKRQGLSCKESKDGIEIQVRIESMGCASCVSTVSKVLDSCAGIIKHSISFGDGIAHITYARECLRSNDDELRNKAWIELHEKLSAAGFPPQRI